MSELQQNFILLATLQEELGLLWDGSKLVGTVQVTEAIRDSIQQLDDSDTDFVTVTVQRDGGLANIPDQLEVDETIQLILRLQRGLGAFFGQNLEDLLSVAGGKYCQKVPEPVLLLEENWRSWESGEEQQHIHAYMEVVKFIDYLRSNVADYDKNDSLLFLGVTEKLELPLRYKSESIISHAGAILDSLASINKLLNTQYCTEDKTRHLKLVLVDTLSRIDRENRFDEFLIRIDQITSKFFHNFELFISNFSFDDDLERLQADSRQFTNQLNTAINTIQSRVIGIPFGTIIPALMLRAKNSIPSSLDLPIFLSSVFIVIFIGIVLVTQIFDLNRVRREYRSKWERMRKEIPTLASKLRSEYRSLEWHYWFNLGLLVFIFLGLILFFTVPLSVYFGWNVSSWGGGLMSWIETKIVGLTE